MAVTRNDWDEQKTNKSEKIKLNCNFMKAYTSIL